MYYTNKEENLPGPSSPLPLRLEGIVGQPLLGVLALLVGNITILLVGNVNNIAGNYISR